MKKIVVVVVMLLIPSDVGDAGAARKPNDLQVVPNHELVGKHE